MISQRILSVQPPRYETVVINDGGNYAYGDPSYVPVLDQTQAGNRHIIIGNAGQSSPLLICQDLQYQVPADQVTSYVCCGRNVS